jgi:hypothetical protein
MKPPNPRNWLKPNQTSTWETYTYQGSANEWNKKWDLQLHELRYSILILLQYCTFCIQLYFNLKLLNDWCDVDEGYIWMFNLNASSFTKQQNKTLKSISKRGRNKNEFEIFAFCLFFKECIPACITNCFMQNTTKAKTRTNVLKRSSTYLLVYHRKLDTNENLSISM